MTSQGPYVQRTYTSFLLGNPLPVLSAVSTELALHILQASNPIMYLCFCLINQTPVLGCKALEPQITWTGMVKSWPAKVHGFSIFVFSRDKKAESE